MCARETDTDKGRKKGEIYAQCCVSLFYHIGQGSMFVSGTTADQI